MNNNYEQYVVQKGDSLYSIAKKYGTTIAEIVDFNTLTSNVIYPNQVLLIPLTDNDEVYVEQYITKNDDTIEKIARATNPTVSPIHRGERTHSHDQVIVPQSLSAVNKIVNAQQNPICIINLPFLLPRSQYDSLLRSHVRIHSPALCGEDFLVLPLRLLLPVHR